MLNSQAQIASFQPQNTIGNSMTIFGLVNGMIGGTILVLPLIGIATGYLMTFIIALLLGFISYFTANLIIVHLGKAKNMQESVLKHFNQNYSYLVAYAVIVWSGQIPLLVLYFNLIILQLEGIIGSYWWIGYLIATALLIEVFIVIYFDIGEQTMGVGILSIVAYAAFVAWALITAPHGEKEVPLVRNPFTLVSTLLMAYSIHDFLTQNIIKNPNKEDYKWIVAVTFIIGTIIYTFIAQGGSYAIANRLSYKKQPQTIEDYFEIGGLEVTLIELLYLAHLFTVFPQYIKLSKIRFFNIIKEENKKGLEWKQTLYLVVVLGVCLIVHLLNLKISTLIAINGGITGNLIVLFIPIIIHLKCIYYDRNCGSVLGMIQEEKGEDSICQCEYTYSNKASKYLQLLFLCVLLCIGFAAIVGAIMEQLNAES